MNGINEKELRDAKIERNILKIPDQDHESEEREDWLMRHSYETKSKKETHTMKDYMKNVYGAFKAFHRKQSELNTRPFISTVELTSRCNLSCEFCNREEVQRSRGFGDMGYKDFADILIKNKGFPIRNLRLFFHGEPTLYRHLPEAINLSREMGAKSIGFTTNGNWPSWFNINRAFNKGLTVLAFSFEGTTPEVYHEIRKGGDYYSVIDNIRKAVHFRDSYHPNVLIYINIVENDLTRPGIKSFVKHWEKYVDFVTVSKLHDWGGSLEMPEMLGPVKSKQPKSCFAPWYGVHILYNGDIVPCCLWFDEPLGNVFESNGDLTEIWNNDKFQQLRYELSKGRQYNEFCKNCNSTVMHVKPYNTTKQNWFFPIDTGLLRLGAGMIKRRIFK